MPDKLFVVSGPAGSGKGTLINRLLLHFGHQLSLSVSVTTRPKGPNEQHGREYDFISQTEFDEMAAKDQLLEHAGVYGKSYGTRRAPVAHALATGRIPVLEVNLAGMEQVRRVYPDAVTIFIVAPSREEAERRMRARGRDTEEVIAKRMREFDKECGGSDRCRYHVTNDDVDATFTYLVEVFARYLVT